jgi:hypothetical protein
MKQRYIVVAMAGALAVLLASCAADHLTASFGIASAAYRQKQIVNPEAGKKNIVSVGLDCSEAAIVAKSYYKSLAAEGGEQQGQQVLILSPEKQQTANLPPPSIPEGGK